MISAHQLSCEKFQNLRQTQILTLFSRPGMRPKLPEDCSGPCNREEDDALDKSQHTERSGVL